MSPQVAKKNDETQKRRRTSRKSAVVTVNPNTKKSEVYKKSPNSLGKFQLKFSKFKLETLSIALFLLSIYSLLCLTLYILNNEYYQYIPGNLFGPFGYSLGFFLFEYFGLSSVLISYLLLEYSKHCWRLSRDIPTKPIAISKLAFGSFMMVLIFTSALVRCISGYRWAGIIGDTIIEPVIRVSGKVGGSLFSAFIVMCFLPLALSLSRSEIYEGLVNIFSSLYLIFIHKPTAYTFLLFTKTSKFLFRKLKYIIGRQTSLFLSSIFKKRNPKILQLPIPEAENIKSTLRKNRLSNSQLSENKLLENNTSENKITAYKKLEVKELDNSLSDIPTNVIELRNSDYKKYNTDTSTKNSVSSVSKSIVSLLPTFNKKSLSKSIADKESKNEYTALSKQENDKNFTHRNKGDYEFPPIDCLYENKERQCNVDRNKECNDVGELIKQKLKNFNIEGEIIKHHPGPVITLYEFKPAPGVKVGRIASLQDDIAMSVKAQAIRVIAPIPNKDTVGIEVPNAKRDIVNLREILESEEWRDAESTLTVAIGKDTYGDPVVVDIASMPHLLIAGATGTGKSVCINTLLISMLYRASPSELQLILIDPKILELSIYEGIPHLKVPVVTHAKQAKAVLDWAVKEMDKRYRIMQKYGVRNIDSYNKVIAGDIEVSDMDESILGKSEDSSNKNNPLDENVSTIEDNSDSGFTDDNPGLIDNKRRILVEELKPLPKIVIVIDELADLMMQVGRDIEELITRLAQKARASGIHLIVATQRPSVDVITGLIKANFPARLSFRVSSRIDSRTILDSMGAEKLLGKGDMLFMQPGANPLKRMHGAFVSDSEVKRVVNRLKLKSTPNYDENILAICEKALTEDSDSNGSSSSNNVGDKEEYDPFYDKAVELVLEKRQASTSMIQRVFRIGYNRAARIIETMEKEGVVGPMDGVKAREVLVPEQF